jgi:hypothetical protein
VMTQSWSLRGRSLQETVSRGAARLLVALIPSAPREDGRPMPRPERWDEGDGAIPASTVLLLSGVPDASGTPIANEKITNGRVHTPNLRLVWSWPKCDLYA